MHGLPQDWGGGSRGNLTEFVLKLLRQGREFVLKLLHQGWDVGIDNDPLFVRHFEKLSRKASIRDGNLTLHLGPMMGKLSS